MSPHVTGKSENDPSYTVTESLAETCPVHSWSSELGPDELVHLAEEISRKTAEVVSSGWSCKRQESKEK